MEVEITEAKGKGHLMDDQMMEVNEVREPKSPSRLTYASDSGLRHRLGFRGKTRRGAIKSAITSMKARSKAKKSGIGFSGGQDKSQLEVIGDGDGVDVVHLTASLRKNAKLISVGPVLEQIKEAKEDEPMLQPLVSPSAPHHIYPINECLVGRVETEKASTNSNLGSENAGSSCTRKTTEWTLLITSLLLEGISASFDQLGYAFTGMVMAFVALLLSIVDLIHKARKEGVTGDGRSLLPCFYRHSSHNSLNWKPFGSLVEYFGLAGAVWQCSFSTIEYYYTRQNKDNPIKMCLLPFIFALCVVISKLVKSHPHEPLVKLEPK